MTGCMVDNIQI